MASGAAVIDPPDWLAPRLAALHAGPHRTGSLIITLYGDAIAQRGGSLSLASLLAIMAALGIGEGVVRTAVSRLAAQGWLERHRIGRHGFYRLAAKGAEIFVEATRRIYGAPRQEQDPRLELVVLGPECAREPARAALEAAGFGGLAWPLADVTERYREFLAVWAAADAATVPDPLTALVGRVLLIHDYRRAVLRDPLLPAALLPADWPQPAARALCARIWCRLLRPSEAWLDTHATAEAGPLPGPDATVASRFADLVGA